MDAIERKARITALMQGMKADAYRAYRKLEMERMERQTVPFGPAIAGAINREGIIGWWVNHADGA